MDEINILRKDIDIIDNQILILINKRMNLCKKVGDVKKRNKMEVSKPGRERLILNNLINKNIVDKNLVNDLWHIIFKYSKNLQKLKSN